MSKTKTPPKIYVVSKKKVAMPAKAKKRFEWLRKVGDIRRAMDREKSSRHGVWLTSADLAESLSSEAWEASQPIEAKRTKQRFGTLVLLDPPRLEELASAKTLFDEVLFGVSREHWLPFDELLEVLDSENAQDLVIGGVVNSAGQTLTLYRGDFSSIAVPLSMFDPSTGGEVRSDSADFEVIDFGHAFRLGEYEAAVDAILYESDPDYRRRQKKQRQREDKTFGACLRRLRVLRGLRQSDFGTIPAKTIARIERGEVAKPQPSTLAKIAAKLGVEVGEIEGY